MSSFLTDFNAKTRQRRSVTYDIIDELRRLSLSKSCLALCNKLINEIAIFYSINGEICDKNIYHMFFCLWNEISLFHKLSYVTARRRILRGLDVPVCVWRHVCASPSVKSVKKLDKTVFFYFWGLNMWLEESEMNFLFVRYLWNFWVRNIPQYFSLVMCFIFLARGHKTHNLCYKNRMEWKFISDPICKSTVFEIIIFTW